MLDHVIPQKEEHMRRLLREYVEYHHLDRTHHSLKKDAPCGRAVDAKPNDGGELIALERVGGLHHRNTWRQAALTVATSRFMAESQFQQRSSCGERYRWCREARNRQHSVLIWPARAAVRDTWTRDLWSPTLQNCRFPRDDTLHVLTDEHVATHNW